MSDEDAASLERRLLELMEKLNGRVESNSAETQRRAEETQRNIDFLVRQQAQFSADVQQMREAQASDMQQLREVQAIDMQQLREVQAGTERIVGRLASASFERMTNLEDKVSALVDSHIRLADAQTQTDGKMNALVDAHVRLSDSQARSDDKLNAFITAVERLISEGRNGK